MGIFIRKYNCVDIIFIDGEFSGSFQTFEVKENLSHDATIRLWELIFTTLLNGLTPMRRSARDLRNVVERSTCEPELDAMVESMFHVLDTDENGL